MAEELEAVATRAQRRGGIAVAITALERAAKLSADPLDRGRRLLRAAELAFELGRPKVAMRLVEEAEPLDLRPLERARMTWIRELTSPVALGDATHVLGLVDLAERASGDGDEDLALDLLWLAASRCFWADPGTEARASVVAAAERIGSADADADVRVLAILAYAAPIERGAIVIDRLASSPGMDGDVESNRLLGSAAIVVGAFDLSLEFLAVAVSAQRAQGRLGHLARLLVLQAWAARHVGDWDAAAPAAEEAGQLAAETGQPVWVAAARAVESVRAGMRGDDELAQALAAEAEALVLPLGASFILAVVQLGRGASALAAGRHEEAYECLSRMFDPADPSHHPFIRTWAIADLADAALHSGHETTARELVRELEAVAAQTPSPWLQLGMRYTRAALAEDEDADRLFQTALDADLGHWPFDRARLLLAYGAWLRRQRRVAESRAPLRAAREAFDALGAIPWGERARQELSASGETSRHRTPEARDELSPQELQIAQVAAGGLTNREIGQHLYLSHRTVGSHLYRIFPKLGITSRAQLSAALEGDIAA